MKKILPNILNIGLCVVIFFSCAGLVFADDIPFPPPEVPYTEDPEVNFVGKTAARAVQFLNWTLQNYEWACYVNPGETTDATPTRKCDNGNNPLIGFWITIRNIIYAFFALIILITAFVLMATRGKSLTLKRFLPRFVAVILLVTLSYALIQFIYTTVDLIQGFFLTKAPPAGGGPRELISAVDLLYVGWDYEYFRGLRKVHPFFDESVFVNLLLARLTAVTYYAMTGVLIIRKIILWFFIVLSPVFPVLLLYYPVRNTAKIWIGEFFRWLLYAPLFAIFLSGLVSIWKSPRLPLIFDFSSVNTKLTYPTATNVLLGGPGQVVTATNNINTPDTFALYVVALIMLWVVILLPFILLQIFLDYLNSFSFEESPSMQKLINTSYLLLNKAPPSPVPLPPPASSGMAKQFPFAKFSTATTIPVTQEGPIGDAMQLPRAASVGDAKQIPLAQPIAFVQSQAQSQLLTAANLSLPTIRDIASFEKEIISNRESNNVSKTIEALRQLGNPTTIQNEIERDRFVQLKDRLIKESASGNTVASSILSAVNVATNISNISNQNTSQIKNLKKTLTNITNPQAVAAGVDRERMTMLHDSLVKETERGSSLATSILKAKENTTVRELQNIKDQLVRESVMGNNISTSVLATSFTKEHESVLKNVLTQVSNPGLVVGVDKERISELHDSLMKESEKGNTLATSILSTRETTTSSEIHDLKEKLIEATLQGNQNASSILSTAITRIDAASTQKIMQQLANPNSITSTITKEKFEKMKDKLVQAQAQGNQFATSMLSKMDAVSKEESSNQAGVDTKEMETVKAQLLDAKTKGEPLADDMLGLFTTEGSIAEGITTPTANRIQSVSLEDYEAVRKMWQENYSGMDVPEGITDRKAWISSEISDVDNILALLTSGDTEKMQEGMQQVGNVLPFLLLGGFSQEEIVSYLKAKKEAGKAVIEEIGKDDDTLVSVETHTTTKASLSQAASIEDSIEDTSPIGTVNISSPNVNSNADLLTLTNLSVPTIRDLVVYETSMQNGDASINNKATDTLSILQKIAHPDSLEDAAEKEKVSAIKQNLTELSDKGDVHAKIILSAIKQSPLTMNGDLKNPIAIFHQYLLELSHPQDYPAVNDNENIRNISEMLSSEVKKQNILADKILMVTIDTPRNHIQDLKTEIRSEAGAGNPLAKSVWDSAPKESTISSQANGENSISLPEANPLQSVSVADYETVREMWEEFYKKSNPPINTMNKREWLIKESDTIRSTLMLLSSHDAEKVQDGLSQVLHLLPFVILGGFSLNEITSYLDAKLHAAGSTLQYLNEPDSEKVLVDSERKSENTATQELSIPTVDADNSVNKN